MYMFDVVFVTRSIILNTLSINISCLYKDSLGEISGTGFDNNYNKKIAFLNLINYIFFVFLDYIL